MTNLKTPYLIFLGDAPDPLAAKVGQGIKDWRPENCIGQLRLPACRADLGLPEMSLSQGRDAGARTLVIGVANRGGVIADNWLTVLRDAIGYGYDIAAGLHNRLNDFDELAMAADRAGTRLIDVRYPKQALAVGDGQRRSGKRVLSVGTDCSCGKMYASLAIEQAMRARDLDADFRATGQTGILICGSGISVDAVVADFISGAVEHIAPAADAGHWDVIEGQGSLFHPSFAGVSTGLLHGAQADALILCHEPTRTHMRGLPHYALPTLQACIDANIQTGRLTNPDVIFAGICINTSQLNQESAAEYMRDIEEIYNLPTVDPMRDGVERIVDRLATM